MALSPGAPWPLPLSAFQPKGPLGRIEFSRERSLYSVGDWWRLFVDGASYLGEPGEWELDESNVGLTEDEPHWLLALLEGCTAARQLGAIDYHGEAMRRFELSCDVSRAWSTAGRRVERPPFLEESDPSQLRVEVLVDTATDRIRHAMATWGRVVTRVELSAFGEAAAIEPPKDSELIPS